jgi:hypothetical protein
VLHRQCHGSMHGHRRLFLAMSFIVQLIGTWRIVLTSVSHSIDRIQGCLLVGGILYILHIGASRVG